MTRNLTCIICPRGCALTAQIAGQNVIVTGHTCPKGQEYAINECLHPVRTVTATVRVVNREDTMVSVKTETPVAKESMMDVIEVLRHLDVEAPVTIGTVIAQDVFGSRILVTKDVQ